MFFELTEDTLMEISSSPMRKYWYYLLPLLLGFFLRVWNISTVQFGIDEGISAALCTQISHFRHFPLTGLETSFGFHNPPTTFYLFAPCFLISSDPRIPSVVMAILGLGAIVMTARATWLMSGSRSAAYLSAWILALCPNAIEHSRRFWGVDTTIFWSSASLLCAVQGYRHRDWRYLAGSFVFAAIAQTMHLSGSLLWVFPLVLFLSWKIPKGIFALGIGLCFVLLIYTPWVISEFLSNFQETGHVYSILVEGAPHKDLGLPVHPLGCWATVLGDFWNNDLLGVYRPFMVSRWAGVLSFLVSVMAIGMLGAGLVGSAIKLYRFKRGREFPFDVLALLLSLLIPPFIFGVLITAAVPSYLLPALVPSVVAVAWSVSLLGCWPRWRLLVGGMVGLYLFVSLLYTVEIRRVLNGYEFTSNLSLKEKMALIAEMGELSEKESFFLAQDGRSMGAGLDVAFVYLLYHFGLNEQQVYSPDDAEHVYVLWEHRSRVRPEVLFFLRQQPQTSFPRATLFEVPEGAREVWLSTLRQFPAPQS
jgi:hypothetical protein